MKLRSFLYNYIYNYMFIIFLQYFPIISLRYIACDSIYVQKKKGQT